MMKLLIIILLVVITSHAAPWSKTVKTATGEKKLWTARDFDYFQDQLENGLLLPPPSTDNEDETWSKTMNFVEPPRKPGKIIDLIYYGKYLPYYSKKQEHIPSSSDSQHNGTTESSSVNSVVTRTYLHSSSADITTMSEVDEKTEEQITTISNTEEPTPTAKRSTTTFTTTQSPILARDGPIISPPVWSPPLISGVLTGSLFKFPSSEEYDRSQGRYTDSFMHGHALDI